MQNRFEMIHVNFNRRSENLGKEIPISGQKQWPWVSAVETKAFTVTYVTCNSPQMGLSVPVDLSENINLERRPDSQHLQPWLHFSSLPCAAILFKLGQRCKLCLKGVQGDLGYDSTSLRSTLHTNAFRNRSVSGLMMSSPCLFWLLTITLSRVKLAASFFLPLFPLSPFPLPFSLSGRPQARCGLGGIWRIRGCSWSSFFFAFSFPLSPLTLSLSLSEALLF